MSDVKLPDGFEVVSADALPVITLDKQKRFYFNASIRKQLMLEPYDNVVLAFNPHDRQLAVIRAESFADKSNVYMLDRRGYASARRFIQHYRYNLDYAPYKFVYSRSLSSNGDAFVFTLSGE